MAVYWGGPTMTYTFTPYDVLQVEQDGAWLDYCTLRDAQDGRDAVHMVTHGQAGGTIHFRIVGTVDYKPGVIKYARAFYREPEGLV
jgi:hypothetical protein